MSVKDDGTGGGKNSFKAELRFSNTKKAHSAICPQATCHVMSGNELQNSAFRNAHVLKLTALTHTHTHPTHTYTPYTHTHTHTHTPSSSHNQLNNGHITAGQPPLTATDDLGSQSPNPYSLRAPNHSLQRSDMRSSPATEQSA